MLAGGEAAFGSLVLSVNCGCTALVKHVDTYWKLSTMREEHDAASAGNSKHINTQAESTAQTVNSLLCQRMETGMRGGQTMTLL